MPVDEEDLRRRLFVAQESLDTELKGWIDPTIETGKAVIAKACMAIRNINGGFLIIGIADNGSCSNRNVPPNVEDRYHPDVIQEIITKFSSEAFEVRVHFVEREGHLRVMIEVPNGVRTPVLCRNNLPKHDTQSQKAGSLLRQNEIYVRTVTANGRVSTAPAGASDWPRMMEICFNNREADIGAFVRRQLSGLDGEKLIEAMHDTVRTIRTPTATELLTAYMDEMYVRFVKRRDKCSPRPIKPGTRESAAIILGDFTHPDLSRQYMTRFLQVRRYSGWPPWVALMNVHSSLGHVAYVDDGWESFEYVTEMFHALDFSRMDASGKFYYVEALWDDMATQVPPGQHLEIVTETARVTEIIATCIAFAHEFCGSDTSTNLAFAFRWRGLTGRRLSTWAHPQRGFRSREVAEQDEIITSITLPVATVPDAIAFHVEALVKPLFRLFGGWEFESSVIEGIVAGRLNSQF